MHVPPEKDWDLRALTLLDLFCQVNAEILALRGTEEPIVCTIVLLGLCAQLAALLRQDWDS